MIIEDRPVDMVRTDRSKRSRRGEIVGHMQPLPRQHGRRQHDEQDEANGDAQPCRRFLQLRDRTVDPLQGAAAARAVLQLPGQGGRQQ